MRVSLALLIVAAIALIRGGGNALSLVPPKRRGEFAGRETPSHDPAKSEWLRQRAREEARLLWLATAFGIAAGVAWLMGY